MAASLNVNDSGTWRKLKELWANDAATWRKLKSLWANDSGTWRQIYQAGIDFTLTANGSAQNSVGTVGKGYNSALTGFGVHGSLSAQPLLAGYGLTIWTLFDITATNEAYVEISGFGSDPGSGFLTSITNVTGGVTRLASAATYNWLGGGLARWYWTPGPTPWGFVGGGTYNMNIVVT